MKPKRNGIFDAIKSGLGAVKGAIDEKIRGPIQAPVPKPNQLDQNIPKLNPVQNMQRAISNFAKGQAFESPIPKTDFMTKGLQAYSKFNQAVQGAPAAAASNLKINIPNWWANAPQDPVAKKIAEARQVNPNLKMTDTQIRDAYKTYGDRLFETLPSQQREQWISQNLQPTPQTNPQWNNFIRLVAEEGMRRGYDPDALIRQKALESAFGQSTFAQQRHNYGGIGAYDRNPDMAFSFESPEEYLNYYFNMIEKRFPEAYKVRGNGREYIRQLKAGNYATDPEYISKVFNTPYYPR